MLRLVEEPWSNAPVRPFEVYSNTFLNTYVARTRSLIQILMTYIVATGVLTRYDKILWHLPRYWHARRDFSLCYILVLIFVSTFKPIFPSDQGLIHSQIADSVVIVVHISSHIHARWKRYGTASSVSDRMIERTTCWLLRKVYLNSVLVTLNGRDSDSNRSHYRSVIPLSALTPQVTSFQRPQQADMNASVCDILYTSLYRLITHFLGYDRRK